MIVRKSPELRPGIQLTRTYYVGFGFPIPTNDPDLNLLEEQELDKRLDRFETFDLMQLRIERGR